MKLLSYFSWKLPFYFVYMLQQVEYDPTKFLDWLARFPNLSTVMRRQTIVKTKKALALVAYSYLMILGYVILNILIALEYSLGELTYILLVPVWTGFMLFAAVSVGWVLIEKPRRKSELKTAEKIFAKHKAIKIAILGSYGKTTMKELLKTVLSADKIVAATEGNKNVLISQARWAKKLTDKEEVLLTEFGEAAPGDIKQMAELTSPDWAVVCGLAPNHLDGYKTLDNVGKDLFSISQFVKKNQLYVNTDSAAVKPYLEKNFISFNQHGLDGWKISQVNSSIEGIAFVMSKSRNLIKVKSGLLGQHQIGPLAVCAVIAHNLGLSDKQIEKSIAATVPFEHRMQPRKLSGGWIIDDTYNGNLEGVLAGLKLLKELKAERKVYVTPGLVDQGQETERVHREIGIAIAKARPDKVVLMKNSATKQIEDGLVAAGYAGDLEVRDDPLDFYTNLDQYIASGDIWLLQNDWTDNYV